MDRLESLGNTLSQITMYDIKSMYNQAKNVVLNVSEMEAKVREATNDEPWGASSTLMQEIAQGTFNFQNFNEIMPSIYARFMEKEAKQWRQIYKALQLLEYLIKNGSERVVDDARSHIATIKMLRNFYYIDEKGKDQGLNVRNRSKELVELLSDVEKIRTERRKAKANKNKYTGTGNDAFSFSSGGSRYGGFGSDSAGYGGSSSSYSGGNGDYPSRSGDYGDYSNGGSGGFRDSSSRKTYEEYDAGDDDVAAVRRSNSLSSPTVSRSAPRRSATSNTHAEPTVTAKAKEPAPIFDLLGMDDDFTSNTANTAVPPVAPAHTEADDDFDDFQTAPPSAGVNTSFLGTAPAAVAAPQPPLAAPLQPRSQPVVQPSAPMQPTNLFAGSNFGILAPTTTASPPPMGMGMAANRTTTSLMTPTTSMAAQNTMFTAQPALTPAAASSRSTPASKPASSANFDDLWTMGLGSSATSASSAGKSLGGAPQPAKSIKDLEKEKAQAGIWGSGQGQGRPAPAASGFGSFASAPAQSSSGSGLDDLLF